MKRNKYVIGKPRTGKPFLSNIFESTSAVAIIDFLIMGRNFNFTIRQISNGTGLSSLTVRKTLKNLLKEEIVVVEKDFVELLDRSIRANHYKINKKSKKYRPLKSLYLCVIQEVLEA